MYSEIKIEALFDLTQTAAEDLLVQFEYPWEVLPHIKDFILELGATLSPEEYNQLADDIWISKEATIAPSAHISGPCIIMSCTEVRHCAFIRGSALVGKDCVVGNSTELKNVILFNNVQVPHFNYVGDSILGYCAHMGAGSITSNIKSDKTDVTIYGLDQPIHTHLTKVGALIGDYVEVGCNSVLNPGAIIGRKSSIYPLSMVRGLIPENSIFKSNSGMIVARMEKATV